MNSNNDDLSPFDLFPHRSGSNHSDRIDGLSVNQPQDDAPELPPRESDKIREQAREQYLQGDIVGAVTLLTQGIQEDPRNTRIAMDMVQIFIDINELEQAKSLFNRLPEADRNNSTGKHLLGQLAFKEMAEKTDGVDTLLERIAENSNNHTARFDLAICHVADHQYDEAMEQLFAIYENEPDFKDGAAKEMIVNLINMLSPNEPELAQNFKRRLGNSLN